jgi:DNA-binding MarR family transcriptional regulator
VPTKPALSTLTETAAALHGALGLLYRRIRQKPVQGDLSLPERSALGRLSTVEPTTATELAGLEQISPQSLGATIASLQRRGLVRRAPDAADGRRSILSLTDAGRAAVRSKRTARTEQFADALAAEFTDEEIELLRAATPLLERLSRTL